MAFDHQTLEPQPGVTLAYRRFHGRSKTLPGILFLGGFMSDMQGVKASFLEDRCRERGQDYLRFDYRGHGLSSGSHDEATIGGRLADTLEVFDRLTAGPQVVVGSSMGGWIALLLALKRPERMAGIVGVAPAPDFTEHTWKHDFSEEQRRHMETTGKVWLPRDDAPPALLTKELFDEAKNHLLLDKTSALPCPLRLIHGRRDLTVPWRTSETILDRLRHADAKVTWVEDGDHRLSRPEDLSLIDGAAAELSLAAQARLKARAQV